MIAEFNITTSKDKKANNLVANIFQPDYYDIKSFNKFFLY